MFGIVGMKFVVGGRGTGGEAAAIELAIREMRGRCLPRRYAHEQCNNADCQVQSGARCRGGLRSLDDCFLSQVLCLLVGRKCNPL